jgi:hypothetical protein
MGFLEADRIDMDVSVVDGDPLLPLLKKTSSSCYAMFTGDTFCFKDFMVSMQQSDRSDH